MTKAFKAFIVSIVALAAFAGFAPASPVAAADPAPVVTCDSLVIHLGETLHCFVSATAGYIPADKITYMNPILHSTINVWNGQGQSFEVTYVPTLGQVGRNEVLSATVYVPTYPGSRLVKPFFGYVYFSVVAAL